MSMSAHNELTGLVRRERTGSEKRTIGLEQIARMLPQSTYITWGGVIPEGVFAAEVMLMGMEDSYCDMWSRGDMLPPRLRSVVNVGMMIGAGNVGNQFELAYHVPAAVYNGVTLDEIAAILVHARPYVGSPAGAWAMQSAIQALTAHGLLEDAEFSPPDLERRERTGSQKRAVARELLAEMEPDSPLLALGEEIPDDVFAPELEFMLLENVYADLWARDTLDRLTRSVLTIGMLIGLANHQALRNHIPVALRNQVSVAQLEEIVYQAATYLGYPSGLAARAAIAAGIEDAASDDPEAAT
jgi:4-carboxymuconolactone decarboxylase